jgi:hypothetical protein
VRDNITEPPILSLAARRKGIARCAALHLDCARSPLNWSVSIPRGGSFPLRERPAFDNRPGLCYVPHRNGDAIDAYYLHVGGAFCKRGSTACFSVSCFQSAYWSSLQTRKLSEQGVLRASGEEQISSVASSGERRQHESESRGHCRPCLSRGCDAGAAGRSPG